MTTNNDIIILGSKLSEGESLRVICPICRGGTSAERSLSITRREGLVWHCFRSKCGVKGTTDSGTFRATNSIAKERPTWEGETHDLPDQVRDRIFEAWGILSPDSWWWTTDYGGRVAMRVQGPRGAGRGWVLRKLTQGGTKVLTFTVADEPSLSWYITHAFGPTYVVEDIPSAVRVSKYANAVALLGTRLTFSRVSELAEYSTPPVIIALDQDATELAFQHALKFALILNTPKVLPLEKDFKDMTEEELIGIIQNERKTCT